MAALFGADPKHAMDDDLVRFKSLLKSGEATAHGREVRREELVELGSDGRAFTGTSLAADDPER